MIYLDNSATTNPKPLSVRNAVCNAMSTYSFNSGRGGYVQSVNTAGKIFDVRQKIADFVNCEVQNVAFTPSCTIALNMAIKGIVKKGSHVIMSDLEHNAVSRTVNTLAQRGIITYDVVPFSYDEDEFVSNVEKCIKPQTVMGIFTGASNVFGVAVPVKKTGKLLHEHGIIMVVDSAQSLGVIDTDMKRDNIDILCAAGHKGLYGPMGTGFIALGDDIHLNTIIEGGTGSSSLLLEQPEFMPDRLESGTLNNSGIIGLEAGVDFVRSKKVERIYNHELNIVSCLYEHLSRNDNVVLYTRHPLEYKCSPILSFNYKDYPSEKTADALGRMGVAVRAGLHCAPLAHKHFRTQDRGTVRLSPSVFTTIRDCNNFLSLLKKV